MIKLTVNWITTELFKLLKESGKKMAENKITPENMAELMSMLLEKQINSSAGQIIFREMFERGSDPSQITETKNLRQMSDEKKLQEIAEKVVAGNSPAVEQYKKGRENALQYLVGQMMKESKGQADPELARELLRKLIQN